MKSEVFNMDCMLGMKQYPDKYFDLAVVDPPFGIGMNWAKDRNAKFYNHRNNFNETVPRKKYFTELLRVSKNQIIWGCNYYWNHLKPTNNLIFWDKGKDAIKQFGSAGEIAWTSFKKYPLVKVSLDCNGCVVCEKTVKIHPHQKPVALYDWIYHHYLPNGGRVLDTHLGSGSSRIAAYKAGNIDFTGYELDKQYYEAQEHRFKMAIDSNYKAIFTKQANLF